MLSAEQLEVRRSGVGASEAASVMGLNPWEGAMAVYLRKTGMVADEPTEAMEAGTYLEEGIARWYADLTGTTLHHCKKTLRHRRWGNILATPDRWIMRGRKREAVLEIKDVGHANDDWGEEGTDEVPVHYLVQVAQQLEVTELPYAKLVAFFHDRRKRPRVYHIERSVELQEQVVDAVNSFWQNHVLPRRAPEIDGSDASREYLRQIYKVHGAEIAPAPAAAAKYAAQYFKACDDEKAVATSKQEASSMLKAYIGERAGIRDYWGTATWKQTSGQGTDWKELAEAMMRGLALGGHDVASLVASHQKPGVRCSS